jgi:hypothetical protein
MKKCNTLDSNHFENLIIEYLTNHPASTITQISEALEMNYIAVHRLLEGRKDSRSLIGLVNTNIIVARAGISESGNLCWKYSINN